MPSPKNIKTVATYLEQYPMDIDVHVPFYYQYVQIQCYQPQQMVHGYSLMYLLRIRIHHRLEIDKCERHLMIVLE